MTEIENQLQNRLTDWDLKLSGRQLEQLRLFYHNLIRWNEVMNLTSITEEQDVYEKHFLDSLSVALLFADHGDLFHPGGRHLRVIDVGTGAGFPGMVLAIAFPDWEITLMDSLGKRIRFLEDTAQQLTLSNVKCFHARAEDLGRDKNCRDQFDLAVSRAVANLNTLSEYCLPFVKPGGAFIAYKSEKVQEEAASLGAAPKKLGAGIPELSEFTLPGTDYRRALVILPKLRTTPSQYPRKAGTPGKEPLH